MRTLAHHVVVLAAIFTAACGVPDDSLDFTTPPEVYQTRILPEPVPAPEGLATALAEAEAATGLDLRSRVQEFRFVRAPFYCTDANGRCVGLTEWPAGKGGAVVTVAMVNMRTGEPTADIRRTAFFHEVGGHVAYGWGAHEKPSTAAKMVDFLYADVF